MQSLHLVAVSLLSFSSVFALDVGVPTSFRGLEVTQLVAEAGKLPALEPPIVVDGEWPPRVKALDVIGVKVGHVAGLDGANGPLVLPANFCGFSSAAEPVADKRANQHSEQGQNGRGNLSQELIHYSQQKGIGIAVGFLGDVLLARFVIWFLWTGN